MLTFFRSPYSRSCMTSAFMAVTSGSFPISSLACCTQARAVAASMAKGHGRCKGGVGEQGCCEAAASIRARTAAGRGPAGSYSRLYPMRMHAAYCY
jgi:hypothetical protein